jgi:hypothetical protein
MSVTLELPEEVVRAYEAAARDQGVSIEALVTAVLVSHLPETEKAISPELIEENGIPVLRSGKALTRDTVNETLEEIRRERFRQVLGELE